MQKIKPSKVMTAREAARYLRISEMTVLRLTNQGMIPGVKIGRQWRYEESAIMNLIRKPELLER